MTITKTDILEMAKALVHICNYECCDYGERHALDIAGGVVANPIDFEVNNKMDKKYTVEYLGTFTIKEVI